MPSSTTTRHGRKLIRCDSHQDMRRQAIRQWRQVSATRRVAVAFREFGIPLIELTEADLAQPGTQSMLGRSSVMLQRIN